MSDRTGKVVALGLGCVLVAGFLWSQRAHPRPPAEPSGAEPVSVRAVDVQERAVPLHSESFGTLRSSRQVVLAARLAARVLRVSVAPGASVAAGDLLVELDSTDLEAHLASAAASLRVAEQELDEARREEGRTRTLVEREARTQQELDAAETRSAAADAGRAAAAGALAAAQAALDDAFLRAPFDGVVMSRSVDPGDLATPGRSLLELYDPSTLRLEASLPERLLPSVAAGDSVAVVIDALAAQGAAPLEVAGRVDEIVPAVDAATRSALVKLALPAIDGALPGMFGRARWPEGERVALAVPRDAVVRRGQLELVFTVSEDGRRARMHLVRTGQALSGERLEILAGLRGAQRVIVGGAEALRDGTPIRLEPGAAAAGGR